MPTEIFTFAYTGASQEFVVPPDVFSVNIECWGAQGGNPFIGGASGGLGGYAKGTLAVTPGETLFLYVGGQGASGSGGQVAGGFNGGGFTYGLTSGDSYGSSGGGATDVRQGGQSLADRVIVGGGGGGTGSYQSTTYGGGAGGGTNGEQSTGWYGSYGPAGGGTQSAGGARGDGGSSYSQDGSLGQGGNNTGTTGGWNGSGGGGGYYGGGSGGALGSGGGGGSGYTGSTTDPVLTPGVRSGNGEIAISYFIEPDTVHPPYTPAVTQVPAVRTAILADNPYAYWPLDDPYKGTDEATVAPTTITGLVSWLNPDALAGADGDPISSAPAVGANPAWFAVGSSGPPTLKRGGLSGRSYLKIEAFRGLACDINLSSSASTVFVVARMRGTRNGRLLSGYRNNWLLGWHGTKEDQYHGEGWWYGDSPAIIGPPVTTNLLTYTGIFTAAGGNDGLLYRNGVLLSEASGGTQGPNGLALAGFQIATNGGSEGQWSDSDVYEVIVYNRVLTLAERANIHEYLRLRHGTVTLPPIQDTAVADVSGNGRAAVLVGNVVKGARPLLRRGFAAKFQSDQRTVIQAPFSTMWPEFTVEVILHPEGAAADGEVISKRSYFATATTDFPFAVTHGADGKITAIFDSGNDFTADQSLVSTSTLARGVAHHVAVVGRNNGVCELWINGVQEAAATIGFAIATGTRNWTLGATAFENGGGVGGLRFNGRLQHWAIFDKALTAVQIQAHHAAAFPAPVGPTTYVGAYEDLVLSHGPEVFWPLHDAPGTTTVTSLVGPTAPVSGGTFGEAIGTFTDDFNRSDRSLAGDNGWLFSKATNDTSNTGSVTIATNRALLAGYVPAILRDVQTSQGALETTVAAYAGEVTTPRMYWSAVGPDQNQNCYFINAGSATTGTLFVRVGTTSTSLGTFEHDGPLATWRIDRTGNVHTVYRNGIQVFQVTDGQINGTYAGIGSASSAGQRHYQDDFKFTPASGLSGPLLGSPGTSFRGSDALSPNIYGTMPAVQAAFTQEFWAKPATTTPLHAEQSSGTNGVSGSPEQAINPEHAQADAGVGVSVGTNGIVVYAHGDAYLPSLLLWTGTVSDWAHIVVVCENRTPRLYVNGTLVRTGVQSPRNLRPSRSLSGGSYGGYSGQIMLFAQYFRALTDTEIAEHNTRGRTAPTARGTFPAAWTSW